VPRIRRRPALCTCRGDPCSRCRTFPRPGQFQIRIYRPRAGRLPALRFLHAGGWVAGGPHTCDGLCAELAAAADAAIVSVQYRLAPRPRKTLPRGVARRGRSHAMAGRRILGDRVEHRPGAVGGRRRECRGHVGRRRRCWHGTGRCRDWRLAYPILDRPAGDEPDPPARLTAQEANGNGAAAYCQDRRATNWQNLYARRTCMESRRQRRGARPLP